MKGFITVLLCILCAYANAQALSDSLPTLDNLLELKWSQRGHRATSNPLVHDGLLFETFGISYAWDAESGQKLSFDRKEDQKRIRQLTSDSIICFSSPEGIAVVNIYSGKIIFRSKSKIKKPLIKKPRVVKGDKIYIATSDSTFSAISIIDGKTVWQKSAVKIFNAPVKQLCAWSLTDRDLVTRVETSHALRKKNKKINRIAAVYFLRMLCPKLFSSLV